MEIFVGTSGFSYKEWKGSFYPEKLPAKQMLAYYGERLPAVEINNTFYRMPKSEVLAGWAEQVPEGFRFVLKVSRRITHFKRLKPEALEDVTYLAEAAQALGERLGVFLFQLPPNFKQDLDRLAPFLDGLSALEKLPPLAFEFRHQSWNEPQVDALLEQHGIAKVMVDTEEQPLEEITRTADWGYLRLRGTRYSDEELAAWCERLVAVGWRRVYLFFKHEDAGTGPAFAKTFLQALERKSGG